MRKLVALALVLFLAVPVCALADFDFSSFDFDALTASELLILRERCLNEFMARDEWQEVMVPQGLYEVGVDIPAGRWTVRCADLGRDDYLMRETSLRWGIGKPNADYYWPYDRDKSDVEIYNPNNDDYVKGEITEFTIELEDGDFIYIHPQYNAAVFSPYTGAKLQFH